jgi:ADP-heptose:LPS heptosyltransferase
MTKRDKRKKIVLHSSLSLGDVVVLTGAIRDFLAVYGYKYSVAVDCPFPELFENNPDVNDFFFRREDDGYFDEDGNLIESHDIYYPLIQESNERPYHFLHGYRKNLAAIFGHIPQGAFRGDIRLSEEEMDDGFLEQYGIEGKYWIINSGGKYDFTAKWWDPDRYREVVQRFAGKIQFVQVGRSKDFHENIPEAINLIDKTPPRALIGLTYHADGILCPVTAMMHLAAAVPQKPGQPECRPCVVVAGAREPAHWEAYPGHRYIENCGALPCSPHGGGCWRGRCQEVGDGADDDKPDRLCRLPVLVRDDLKIPRCLDMISVDDVERAILSYYEGGVLSFDGNHPNPIHNWRPEF